MTKKQEDALAVEALETYRDARAKLETALAADAVSRAKIETAYADTLVRVAALLRKLSALHKYPSK